MKKYLSILVLLALLIGIFSAAAEDAEKETYDIDLYGLSDTIVYSQILNILGNKEDYVGKTIRYRGWFDYQEGSKNTYFFAQVPDLAGCCYNGLEFIWAGEHQFPDDYPGYGDDIVIAGRMEIYDEDGSVFMHVVDATVTW